MRWRLPRIGVERSRKSQRRRVRKTDEKRSEGGQGKDREVARPEKLNCKDHRRAGVGEIRQARRSVEREHLFSLLFSHFIGCFSVRASVNPLDRAPERDGNTPSETELLRELRRKGTIARSCVKNEDIQMEIWFYINQLVEAAAASFYLTEQTSLSHSIVRSLFASNVSPFVEHTPSRFSSRFEPRFRVPLHIYLPLLLSFNRLPRCASFFVCFLLSFFSPESGLARDRRPSR